MRSRKDFTMVELLAVMAVIALLAGTLLVALSIARKKARITSTQSDLKEMATAVNRYSYDFGSCPPDGLVPKGEEATYPDRAFNYAGSVGPKYEDWSNEHRVERSSCGLVLWLDFFKVIGRDLNHNGRIDDDWDVPNRAPGSDGMLTPSDSEVLKLTKFYNKHASKSMEFSPTRLKETYRIYDDVYYKYFGPEPEVVGTYENHLHKVGVYVDYFGQPYIYRRFNKSDYIIYSRGPNLKDDSTPLSVVSSGYDPPAAAGTLATHPVGMHTITGDNVNIDGAEQSAAKGSDDIWTCPKQLFP